MATPHNSGADLYPYLVLTAQLTDPDLYQGRMLEMLRNEVRYTSAQASVPGNLTFATGQLGPPSLFGAGEYAKDGLVSVTETSAARRGSIAWSTSPWTRWRRLPSRRARDAPLLGYRAQRRHLQTLTRLITMTDDARFLEWARRIGDAYVDEVMAGNFGGPGMRWDSSPTAATVACACAITATRPWSA